MVSYLEWVNEELTKIPKIPIKGKKKKNSTLEYVCANLIKFNSVCLEFGVWKGNTANLISKYIKTVHGFDSFEGLPEEWIGVAPKSTFAIEGLPVVNENVFLVKGLFEDTLEQFLQKNEDLDVSLIHIDCDLYSSTKFVFDNLLRTGLLKKNTIIVFDELINYNNFLDGEILAFYEILTQSNLKFEWIGTHGNVANTQFIDSHKNWSFKQFRSNGYQQEVAIRIL